MSRRRKALTVKEDVTCNLIPMVDIMFLLLLFFILGADMTQRERAELVLPTASEIKEDEKIRSPDKTTTVNIQHRPDSSGFTCATNARGGYCRDMEHWMMVIRDRDFTRDAVKAQLQEEAQATMEQDIDLAAGVRLSALKVVIRADRAAPYGDIQKLIEICSQVGIYKIEVGAAVPPQG